MLAKQYSIEAWTGRFREYRKKPQIKSQSVNKTLTTDNTDISIESLLTFLLRDYIPIRVYPIDFVQLED